MTGRDATPIDPSNAEQARAWDGDEGAYWAAHADEFDRAVASQHASLMAVAAIGDGDRVLDVGCGTGQTTRDAARASASGSALGVDLSSAMLDHARRRAAEEGIDNAAHEQADAQIHPFAPGTFDVLLSRTGAMFFGDRKAACANLHRAVRPGGRLAITTWQAPPRNEWFLAFTGAFAAGRVLPAPPPGAPSPFALADPDHIADVLGSAGFHEIETEAESSPMWFGDDGEAAQRFVVGQLRWMLDGLDDTARRRALDALRASLDAHETPDGVVYESGFWLVTARRP